MSWKPLPEFEKISVVTTLENNKLIIKGNSELVENYKNKIIEMLKEDFGEFSKEDINFDDFNSIVFNEK